MIERQTAIVSGRLGGDGATVNARLTAMVIHRMAGSLWRTLCSSWRGPLRRDLTSGAGAGIGVRRSCGRRPETAQVSNFGRTASAFAICPIMSRVSMRFYPGRVVGSRNPWYRVGIAGCRWPRCRLDPMVIHNKWRLLHSATGPCRRLAGEGSSRPIPGLKLSRNAPRRYGFCPLRSTPPMLISVRSEMVSEAGIDATIRED